MNAFVVDFDGHQLRVTGHRTRSYPLGRRDHAAWLDVSVAMAADFGARVPLARQPAQAPPPDPRLAPILTHAVCEDILYGYGDPSVLCVPDAPGGRCWYLAATSNDAPQSFPILRSRDLRAWEIASFAFPRGAKPAWVLDGPDADFWAPELHRVGDEIWLVFSARQRDGVLAIGLARARAPEGPYVASDEPLIGDGVIDPHLHVGPEGPVLFWKEDANDRWPGLLARRLREWPGLVDLLFDAEEDRRTAELAAALEPRFRGLAPMERSFALQTLIEAVVVDLPRFEARLAAVDPAAGPILDALKTRIRAQRLSPDGRSLVGEPRLVLHNDQPWEAHVLEGVWVTQQAGRCWLFYAGNDFSTAAYGIGVAVADDPLGPYRKFPGPLVASCRDWSGPGHPSVAPGPDGLPHLFLHAYNAGTVGYKAFRSVLASRLAFDGDRVVLSAPSDGTPSPALPAGAGDAR